MQSDPLILLHGWGMSPDIFAPLAQQIDVTEMHIPSLPGYPQSHWPFKPDFAWQLEKMLQDLPAGHLLGWSLGGLFAIELALRAPDKFNQLTLIACNPCFVQRSDWPHAVEADVFDRFNQDLAEDWQRTLRRFLSLQMHGENNARQRSREIADKILVRGAPDPTVLKFGLKLLKQHDARPSLQQLKQPLSLILGERDLLVPIELQRQISKVSPKIRVESVAGAAHAPFLSHTADVLALI